jgi:hypothetical protein
VTPDCAPLVLTRNWSASVPVVKSFQTSLAWPMTAAPVCAWPLPEENWTSIALLALAADGQEQGGGDGGEEAHGGSGSARPPSGCARFQGARRLQAGVVVLANKHRAWGAVGMAQAAAAPGLLGAGDRETGASGTDRTNANGATPGR